MTDRDERISAAARPPAALPAAFGVSGASGFPGDRTAGLAETAAWWTATRGDGPIVATAIHDGHGLRAEAAARMKLAPLDRLREEDPHTGEMIAAIPSRVIVHRSRFEVDLNRAREQAVYREPEQAWGLDIWQQPPDDGFVHRSLTLHDAFYRMMRGLLDGIVEEHGSFVLLDVHSYNHRRDGPHGAPSDIAKAPDINLGTFSMPPRRWDAVLDTLVEGVRRFDFPGRRLSVGIDVAFQGRGALTRFVHQNYPETGCAIALEVKKFFMDEWTGVPHRDHIAALQAMFAVLLPDLRTSLGACAADDAIPASRSAPR